MELTIRLLKWSAGLPVAMMNSKTAEKLGVHPKDRIFIKTLSKGSKDFSSIVDTADGLIKKNEIAISFELKEVLGIRNGERVRVSLEQDPPSIVFIRKKLDGKSLSEKEIFEIINDIVENSLSEAEVALFISAMYRNGTTMKETISLIKAISSTGEKLKIKGKDIVDKHSIGGIAGNRTTPIIVAICTSLGLTMPKSSSRAITSAAGTADVIESIAKVDFSMKEIKKIVNKTGGCLVWGGGLGMVPADDKIIQVEKQLEIDPEAQLLASIMAKKLAMGSKYILIDIPYGKTAKVSKKEGLKLKKKFEYLGKVFNKKLECVLTDGSQPMGSGVGPVLELNDVISVLRQETGRPLDLEDKSLFLAGRLLEMTGKAKKGEGIKLARKSLVSGSAYKKFSEIIRAQKGKVRKISPAKLKKEIIAQKSGKVKLIDNKKINRTARIAGCPADKRAGLLIDVSVGNQIKKGERLLTIYSESKYRMAQALKYFRSEKPILLS